MRIFNTSVIILIAFLIFVVFPLYRGAYASSDLAGMWYSAFIGSIITYFLLTMQSKGEVERERQAEVFKERLDIYQDFLKKLYDIVEDREVEDKEFLNLQFQLSYLAMHTDRERMEIIQKHTFEILKEVCAPMSTDQKGQRGTKKDPVFMNHLYEIVRQMQAQLYENNEMKPLDKGSYEWEKWKEESHAAFEKCLLNSGISLNKKEMADQSIKHTVDDETLKRISSIFLSSKKNDKSADHNTPNELDEKKAAEAWKIHLEEKYPEWEFLFEDKNNKSQGFQIRSVDKHNGHVGIRYNIDSGLYSIFANYWKNGVNQSEFSRPMKWEFGGTRSYGAWSVPLNSKRMGITTPIEPSKLYTCLMSDAVKPILLEKIDLIVDNLEKHNRTVEWMLALKNEGLDEKKWGAEVWYWDDLVCTAMQDHPEFGKFRIGVKANDEDIKDKKEKKIELILENTEYDHDKLVKALKRLGMEDDIPDLKDKNGTLVRKVPIDNNDNLTNQIAKKVKEITDLIEKGA